MRFIDVVVGRGSIGTPRAYERGEDDIAADPTATVIKTERRNAAEEGKENKEKCYQLKAVVVYFFFFGPNSFL